MLDRGGIGSGKTRLAKTICNYTGCTIGHDPYHDFIGLRQNLNVIVYDELGKLIDLSSTRAPDMKLKQQLFQNASQARHNHLTVWLLCQVREIYCKFDEIEKIELICFRVPRSPFEEYEGSDVLVKAPGFHCKYYITSEELLSTNR
nr:hypothetical protein [Candidatus Sigynarchaeota archaeon]